ncbi:MAG: NADH-quinone oxidoreductase subunit NuoE [Bacteroidales bacterium]|nr:NADH-quinone oxidoreductase subunit NuoE [Bacteroidales bacterium]NCA76097.1 NADH-quinone oxidoreductase subunit NuoE [Alphaproteobacteria bacterium]HNW72831.1 NADH-quinone oxidoreductase subunit NuoE [Bacteroidales bacterium]HPS50029.1 NADH-quinone oxidoreductase subunit NuoE [Bacteroidales bacterium]
MTECQSLIRELADKYGRERASLLPILQGVVERDNFLSDTCMTDIAKELDISAAQVYGTATFYSFLETQPRGEYVIRVCKTITCDMHGKKQIVQTLEDMLKIKVGETTPNKKFTLLETNCLGWCHEGPAMLINEKPYSGLTPEKVHDIISEYINK